MAAQGSDGGSVTVSRAEDGGGLAICHAVAQGYTVIDEVHKNCLHGEMVAMGILAQLKLEQADEEAGQENEKS